MLRDKVFCHFACFLPFIEVTDKIIIQIYDNLKFHMKEKSFNIHKDLY